MTDSNFYSNGKLLLTGEYLVLDGALALALPTKFGQSLLVTSHTADFIDWKSFDENDDLWFENSFFIEEIESNKQVKGNTISKNLGNILHVAKQLNPDFNLGHVSIETHLTFPRSWGLGTSSTLINNVANWAQVDPYQLLKQTFGGSGYDIACAQHNSAITYRLNEKGRDIQIVDFNPEFKDCLYFVYLNKKQNSRDAIKSYRENTSDLSQVITETNKITNAIISCQSLSEFNVLLDKHEQIIGSILKKTPIKDQLFNNFNGCIKSLGAWGGDFVLVTSKENPSAYFKAKGFETIIPYNDIIL